MHAAEIVIRRIDRNPVAIIFGSELLQGAKDQSVEGAAEGAEKCSCTWPKPL